MIVTALMAALWLAPPVLDSCIQVETVLDGTTADISARLRDAVASAKPPRGYRLPAGKKETRFAYPEPARRARVEGLVRVTLELGADGKVKDVRIVEGPAELAEPTSREARRWTFVPFQIDGVDQPIVAHVKVMYRLKPCSFPLF
jgi:TonB family protein